MASSKRRHDEGASSASGAAPLQLAFEDMSFMRDSFLEHYSQLFSEKSFRTERLRDDTESLERLFAQMIPLPLRAMFFRAMFVCIYSLSSHETVTGGPEHFARLADECKTLLDAIQNNDPLPKNLCFFWVFHLLRAHLHKQLQAIQSLIIPEWILRQIVHAKLRNSAQVMEAVSVLEKFTGLKLNDIISIILKHAKELDTILMRSYVTE